MKHRMSEGAKGSAVKNTVTRIGQYCGHGMAKPVKNAVATQPKNVGPRKIKGAVT